MVYVGQARLSTAWSSPSACIWSSPPRIAGKATIKHLYRDLELRLFFTKVLGVARTALDSVHEDLLKAESVNSSANQVRLLLKTLNSLLRRASNPPSPNRLLQSRSFPVRAPGESEATLVSCEAEFCIVDRDDMFASFRDRVRYLDFSLNEVCYMKPFIKWAGLGSRFLSQSIEEVSTVHGNIQWPIRDSKRDIGRKADGLLRCVSQFSLVHQTRSGGIANSRLELRRGTAVPDTRPIPRGCTLCSKQLRRWNVRASRQR